MKKEKIFLTKDFNHVFNQKGAKGFLYKIIKFPLFLYHVNKSGKTVELISFILWELFVRMKIILKPIQFKKSNFFTLNDENLDDIQIQDQLSELLNRHGFKVDKAPIFKKIFLENDNEGWGCLNNEQSVLVYLNVKNNKYIVSNKHRFSHDISSIYVNSKKHIFVCVNGKILKSVDNGESFVNVIRLSHSTCTFRFHCGVTELPNGGLILGEYGNLWNSLGWKFCANLYYSFDGGDKWQKSDFLIKQGVNKHIHIVKYFRNIDRLVMTDGDNKKQIWVHDLKSDFLKKKQGGWKLLTKFHLDMGGYTSATEFENEAILGTDYFGGTNFIVNTSDFVHFDRRFIPNPYRRGMVTSLQKAGFLLWAHIAPPDFGSSKGLLMMKNKSRLWCRIIEYDKKKYNVELISNSVRNNNNIFISIRKVNSKQPYVFNLKYSEINTGYNN